MKRLSRGEKWLLAVCGAVMLGLAGVGLVGDLEAEPDWGIPAPHPTPSPNGFDLYRFAGAAIIPAVPAVDPINETPTNTVTGPDDITISIATGLPVVVPPKDSPRYSLARRVAWLQQNAKVSVLFERAKAANSSHPSTRGNNLAANTYAPLKRLRLYKVVAINTAKMRGDWKDAVRNGLDLLELAGDIRRGAALSGYGFASGIGNLGEDGLVDTPTHLTASQATYAAKRLEKLLASHEPMAQILREEKWWQLERLREIMRTQPWRSARIWEENASRREALRLRFLSKRHIVESYKRTADWYIREAEQPYDPNPKSPPKADNLINQDINPEYKELRYAVARKDTRLSLLLLRFALRAYRIEKGKYPARLSELAPGYLTKIPKDPFGRGGPLRYRKTGDNYVVWSIGPDAKDDGGKPIPPRNKRKMGQIPREMSGDVIATPEQQPVRFSG